MSEIDREVLLHKGFIAERKNKKMFSTVSSIVLSFTSIFFLYLLFSSGYLADTRLALLLYWGYFSSLSSIILVPYYQIPGLILGIHTEDSSNADASWNLIQKNPGYYLKPVIQILESKIPEGFQQNTNKLLIDRSQLIDALQLRDRLDWKKIGRRYLIFYLSASSIMFYFFVQGLLSQF